MFHFTLPSTEMRLFHNLFLDIVSELKRAGGLMFDSLPPRKAN